MVWSPRLMPSGRSDLLATIAGMSFVSRLLGAVQQFPLIHLMPIRVYFDVTSQNEHQSSSRENQRKRRENRSLSFMTKRIRTGWPAYSPRSLPPCQQTTCSILSPTIAGQSSSVKPGSG